MNVVSAVLLLFVLLLNVSIKSIRCDITFESTEDSDDPTGWRFVDVSNHKFVDPTGWNYDRETKRSQRSDENEDTVAFCSRLLETETSKQTITDDMQVKSANITHNFSKRCKSNVAFVRRFVNLLLESADLPNKFKNNENDAFGVIEVRLTFQQYETLTQFGKSQKHISFKEIDSVLSGSIHGRSPFNTEQAIEKILFIISQKEYWLPFVLFFIALFLMRLIANSKTVSGFTVSLLLLIFTTSYLIEYYRLYKEAEIKQKAFLGKHIDIPRSCLPENKSWLSALWDSMVSSVTFKNEECEEYYKAVLLDPLIEVSPLRVLSHILADFVLAPVSKIGQTISAFATAIIGGLPIQYGFIVWTISCLGFFIFLCLILILLCGHSLHLGNFLGGITISRRDKPQITSRSVPMLTMNAACKGCSLSTTGGKSKYVLVEANDFKKLIGPGPSNRIEELENTNSRTNSSKPTIEETAVLKRLSSEESIPMEKDIPEETIQIVKLDSLNKGSLCEVFEKCETLESNISHQGTTSSTCETGQVSNSNVNVTNLVENAVNESVSEEWTAYEDTNKNQ